MTDNAGSISCSCLCGDVQFVIDSVLDSARYCYCRYCTKFAGTSPATWAMAASVDVVNDGLDRLVSRYDSGNGNRTFCRRCGSAVWFESHANPDITAIPLGVIDTGSVPKPTMHIFTASKPDWCSISDSLPQHSLYPG